MQAELGIEPKTIEQRHQEYLIRKAEELRRGQELAQLKLRMKHPPLRRKV